jgi:hypothetical protein
LVFALAAVLAPAGESRPLVVPRAQQLVALLTPHVARAGPAARTLAIGRVPAKTPITEETTKLPVLAHRGRWIEVRLPGRPNGHTGWIVAGGTVSFATKWHLVLRLARRELTVYRSGRPVRVISVVVGKPSTPTPMGEFFVEETVALPSDRAGAPFALALSARSDVFQEFEGGPGQIAIHGVANVGGTPGTAASHGCVRLATAAIVWLAARIAPGVPVTIIAR